TKARAPLPKPKQPQLDMTQNVAIPLPRRDRRTRFPERACNAALAIAPHHSRALQLRKLRKPANANGAHRLAPNLRYKMRRARKIVAVELFVERTILLAHVNNAAQRIDLRQLIQRPHNVDNDRAHAAAAFISSPTKGA